MKYRILIFISIASVVAGCVSRKPTTDSKYVRPAIKEVTQQQIDIDSKLIDALSLQESGRENEALDAYAELVKTYPQCAAAWFEISKITLHRRWTDSALVCIERAVKLNNKNIWYLKTQAEAYTQTGDYKKLIDTYERIVNLQPTVLEHYYNLSNAHLPIGDYEGAIKALDRVEKMIGITEPISLQKQKLWMAAGKPAKAEKEMEVLAATIPQEKKYSAIMAEMNMSQGNYAKAKKYYDRILTSNPDDEYIHIQLAEYYKRTGKPDDADREMIAAFENPKLDCPTKIQLLSSFYTNEEFYTNRKATTFKLLEMAMKDCDDSAQYAVIYGDVLMRQGKYSDAVHWLKLSLTLDSSRYEIWEGLLMCLTELPEHEDEMAKIAARTAKLFPMKTMPHYIMALYNIQRNNYDAAIKELETTTKWGFNKGYLEAECYAMMGECYYRTKQYDKAWRSFDHSIGLKPNNMETLNNYAYYLSELNILLDKAEQMSRRTIEAEPENANFLDTYAWILHLTGRDKEALPYTAKAVKLDPKSNTLKEHFDIINKAIK